MGRREKDWEVGRNLERRSNGRGWSMTLKRSEVNLRRKGCLKGVQSLLKKKRNLLKIR